MCKIIQFKAKETNGYKNLVDLFEICNSVESCNFYLESAEDLYKNGSITENELYTLRRIGRQKRIALANPEPEPVKVWQSGVYHYTPEMGQKEPDGCQMEAGLCYYGKHYWVDTPIELKGRGITETEAHWVDGCKKQIENWRSYRVTKKAFEKLKERYCIVMECCLD